MAVERTLSIIKPDAVAKNVIGAIYTRFESAGLKIAGGEETGSLEGLGERALDVPSIVPAHLGLASYHLARGNPAKAVRIGEAGLAIADRSARRGPARGRETPPSIRRLAHVLAGEQRFALANPRSGSPGPALMGNPTLPRGAPGERRCLGLLASRVKAARGETQRRQ